MSSKVVLTDVSKGVWLDRYSLTPADGVTLSGAADWSISKRTLRGGRSDGVDVVEVNNGVLSVEVLPTRGMGIWRANCEGVRVGWDSPVGDPVHPAFVNLVERDGLGWLSGFNELLCRCGLASNGPPGTEEITQEDGSVSRSFLTLHGKIANLPAHHVELKVSAAGEGRLSLTGLVDECSLFGPCLRLASTLETAAGTKAFRVIDEVTNRSGRPAELSLLYHTNVGPPLLEAGSRFVAPVRELAPRDSAAAAGIEHWAVYGAPLAEYAEQCYFADTLGGKDDQTLVLLTNTTGDRGFSIRYSRRQLPCFTLWKNTQSEADGYVSGLEPGINYPNFRSFERQQGRLVSLLPGESYRVELELSVQTAAEEVSAVLDEIDALQSAAAPQVHAQPLARLSPVD